MDKNVLIQKRGRVKSSITRIKSFADNIDDQTPLEDIQIRLDKLKEAWGEFTDIEDNLLIFEGQSSEIEEYENKFYDAHSMLLRALRAGRNDDPTSIHDLNTTISQLLQQQQTFYEVLDRNNDSSKIRLPRLNIPYFSGDYKEWPSFQDLFEASVHSSNSLSPCQKFQYLKGLLKGSAASLIRHLPVSDSNYSEAWTKLKERFDKRPHIVTSLIKTYMDQPSLNQPSIKALRNMYDMCDEVVRGLKALGPSAESRDPWLTYIALTKLDFDTRESWSKEVGSSEYPTFDDFLKFLNKRCDALETAAVISKRPSNSAKVLHVTSTSMSCPRCGADHPLFQCSTFKSDLASARRSFVVTHNLCFKCLGSNHSVRVCHSKMQCKRCKGKHHPLLHNEPVSTKDANRTTQPREIPSLNNSLESSPNSPVHDQQLETASIFNASITGKTSTLFLQEQSSQYPTKTALPTAVACVIDAQGIPQLCRILLDPGSEVTMVTESCVQRLRLQRTNGRLFINGVFDVQAGVTKGKVQLTVCSRWNKSNKIEAVAFIKNKLTSLIPSHPYTLLPWKDLDRLQLADPNFNKPSPIDIILGADHFFEVLRPGQVTDQTKKAFAQDTMFGWIVSGKIPLNVSTALSCHSMTSLDLDKSLGRFWQIEEVSIQSQMLGEDKTSCEQHFKNNYSRTKSGRYMVALPFNTDSRALGESLHNARTRLYATERRFSKDLDLKRQYVKFMQEYEELGHMQLIPPDEVTIDPQKSYYLPHHAVFKRDPVPKIRVVFDGSAKTDSGISLNQTLFVGPTIQRDLSTILISFRQHRIAFSADLEKMYRQILMTPSHRDYQRIIWRENPSNPIKHYRLNTVTYGTASAPFLATRVLRQISEDNKETYSRASQIIKEDFYVDDLLTGADSLEDALDLKTQLTHIFRSSGFNLTKWRSNSKPLLSTDQSDNREPNQEHVRITDDENISNVLGIRWNPQDDAFMFELSTVNDSLCSKRTILSEFSRIFDPLGWLAPVTIAIKIMFQQLWLLKYDWDDPLPEDILAKWTAFKQELHSIETIRIPRRIVSTTSNIQLHGFSDASEAAYAAVVYCRSFDENGVVTIRNVACKTKVAPLKQISLPRLELCGALLLTRLMDKIKRSLSFGAIDVYAWTDSTIVLAWLSSVPRRWKCFIANRTSEILDSIPRTCWRHVSSADNPADVASRGIQPRELAQHDMWWSGPSWLSKDPSNWPEKSMKPSSIEIKREERRECMLACVQEVSTNVFDYLFNRISSFSQLIRIIAYCCRFIDNCRKSPQRQAGNLLSTKELNKAQSMCFKEVQRTTFSEEIRDIKTKGHVSSKGTLSSLNPFLDQDKVLRVGGRVQNSGFNYNAKHPIILPKDHPVSSMIVDYTHRTYLHPGTTLLIGLIRQRYWIIGVKQLASKTFRNCIICFRQRATKSSQLMGNLPEARVTISRPFSRVGIDYAGPLTLTSRPGRGVKTFKGYIALFVCLATRAIHIELVSSLSAEAFVAALRRFSSRRGIPSHIFSDNGTNFVGGKRLLKELHELATSSINKPLMSTFLSQNSITWHFIPPGSPHFGGLWEAGVKGIKWHLRRVIGDAVLSFEEIHTLLAQVEAVLNSRPYSAVSDDPNDLDALTPGHFLIGEPPTTIPEPNILDVKVSRLGRWQHVQAMMQNLWQRWRLEYITSLQQRPKWKQQRDNLKKDDLVLIREDNLPPSKWLMGRIITCHPGTDGLVRVVTLRTRHGVLDRSISKVAKLPLC